MFQDSWVVSSAVSGTESYLAFYAQGLRVGLAQRINIQRAYGHSSLLQICT